MPPPRVVARHHRRTSSPSRLRLLLLTAAISLTTSTLRYADVLPRFRPGRSSRQCHVHSCKELGERAATMARKKKCDRRRGHFQPMGSQIETPEVPRVTVTDSNEFYTKYVAGSKPVVLAGGGSGHAFKMGPAIGDCATALALDEPPPLSLRRFEVERMAAYAEYDPDGGIRH